MYTETNAKQGLVRTCWYSVKNRVRKINPEFAAIVDEIDPGMDFPLYLAYYPYGVELDGEKSFRLPNPDDTLFEITDPHVDKTIVDELGYGIGAAPLAMLLQKNVELFLDRPKYELTLSARVYKPGEFLSVTRILSDNLDIRFLDSNEMWRATSGCRSVFMLPNIKRQDGFSSLRRVYKTKARPPHSLYFHHETFMDLTNHYYKQNKREKKWRSCIMYFSKQWADNIRKPPNLTWKKLKGVLYEYAWDLFAYPRSQFGYHFAFSKAIKDRKMKPDPFLVDTFKHLFKICMNSAPGFAPALDNESLPAEILQIMFVETYRLIDHPPVILAPKMYDFMKDKFPIYYSLKYPTATAFAQSFNKNKNTIVRIKDLDWIMEKLLIEFTKPNAPCHTTIFGEVARNLSWNFYHTTKDEEGILKPTSELPKADRRFTTNEQFHSASRVTIQKMPDWMTGCIALKVKPES